MILWGRRIVVLCSLLMIHRLLLVALEVLLLLLRLWLLHLVSKIYNSTQEVRNHMKNGKLT